MHALPDGWEMTFSKRSWVGVVRAAEMAEMADSVVNESKW